MPAISVTTHRSVVKDLSSTTTVGGYKGRGTLFKINRIRVNAMTLWDWMFVFYCSAALTVAALLFIRWARPKPQTYPKDWVCDGCGQVCGELKEGYCEYCAKQY